MPPRAFPFNVIWSLLSEGEAEGDEDDDEGLTAMRVLLAGSIS